MGEPAKKLQPRPEMSPLEPGDIEVSGLIFPTSTRLGTSLVLGRGYDFAFDCSGIVERVAVKKNGNAIATVRIGGNFIDGKLANYAYRDVIFFQNGMYGAVVEPK